MTAEEPSDVGSGSGKAVEGSHNAMPLMNDMSYVVPTRSDVSDETHIEPPAVDSKPKYELDRFTD